MSKPEKPAGDLPEGRGRKALLAKAWEVHPTYIGQLVKKNGMPLDEFRTIAEATEWREANAMRRSSPMSRQSKSVKAARRAARQPGDESGQPDTRRQEKRGDGSLEDALAATVTVADRALSLVEEAMDGRDLAAIPPLLSIHNKAIEQQFKAHQKYREEMERRKLLVVYSTATEEFRRGITFILTRMDRLPDQQAPRCNPGNPMLAMEILKSAITRIKEDVQKEYAAA